MTGGAALPRLTKPQIVRLVEVATGSSMAKLASHSPRTNDALVTLGVLERHQWRTMKFVRPTAVGIRVLAGFPGDEFDRFRAALAAQEKPHA